MKYHRFCYMLQGGRESIDLSRKSKKVDTFLLLFITLLVLSVASLGGYFLTSFTMVGFLQ